VERRLRDQSSKGKRKIGLQIKKASWMIIDQFIVSEKGERYKKKQKDPRITKIGANLFEGGRQFKPKNTNSNLSR